MLVVVKSLLIFAFDNVTFKALDTHFTKSFFVGTF
jgi:hypothetical protein